MIIRRLGRLVFVLLPLAACSLRGLPAPSACTLRVGTSGDYAPFSIASDEGDSGLDIDLARRFAGDLGCSIEIIHFAWPDLLRRLERGDFDLALSGITMRPERALYGTFSRPYARTGVVVIVGGNRRSRTVADLDQPTVRLAVNRGGHLEKWARSHLPQADIESVDDNRSLPDRLRSGTVDGIVTDTAEARGWAQTGRMLGPLSTDYKAALVAHRRSDIATKIDRWLAARETDGWLGDLRDRHLRDRQLDGSAAATMQSIASLVYLRLALMPMVAAAKSAAGSGVTDNRQEHRVIQRARAWSHGPNPRIEVVFAAFIELAKSIQKRSAGTSPTASLDELRAAIGNIDRQIVRELDRLPKAPRERWRAVLAPIADGLPLQAEELDQLATALASQAPPELGE